jgi:hypothetical protein
MLPDDVLQIIKEYSRPYYRNWRKGSSIHQYYKTIQNQYLSNTLVEDLQIYIVRKWFSYDRFVHLKLEYKLIQKSIKYRDLQYGAGRNFGMRKRGIKEDIQETIETGIGHKNVENRRFMLNNFDV